MTLEELRVITADCYIVGPIVLEAIEAKQAARRSRWLLSSCSRDEPNELDNMAVLHGSNIERLRRLRTTLRENYGLDLD